MIEIKKLVKQIGTKKILDGISLDIPSVGLVLITGKNGSGKTTFINILSGIDNCTSGSVEAFGQNITKYDEGRLCIYREKYLSIMTQNDELFDEMTVLDNLKVVGNPLDNNLVDKLKIGHLLNEKIKSLSGGERQKVAFVRAISKKSKILILDEPTSSMDDDSKNEVYELLRKESKYRLVIMVSHEPNLEQSRSVKMIIHFKDGKITTKKRISKTAPNEIPLYTNTFSPIGFAKKNFFKNKKQMIKTGRLLIFTFLIMLFLGSFLLFDIDKATVDTMVREKDGNVIFYNKEKPIDEEDIEFLNENKLSSSPLMIGYKITVEGEEIGFKFGEEQKDFNKRAIFYNFDCVEKLDYGREPKKANEIIINSYLAELMVKNGVKNIKGETYYPDISSIVLEDVEISLGGQAVRIVGISNIGHRTFDEEKDVSKIAKSINGVMKDTEFLEVYVQNSFFELFSGNSSIDEDYTFFVNGDLRNTYRANILGSQVALNDGSIIDELEPKNVIINFKLLMEVCNGDVRECNGKAISFKISDGDKEDDLGTFTIAGISEDNRIYFHKDTLEKYDKKGKYIEMVKLIENDRAVLEKIIDKFDKDGEYGILTHYTGAYQMIQETVYLLMIVIGIIGFIISIFTIILLINYTCDSFDSHRREIGILKILGISNRKIMCSFAYEIFSIVLTSLLYSFVTFAILRVPINYIVSELIYMKIAIIPLSILAVVEILLITGVFIIMPIILVAKKLKKVLPRELYNEYRL